MHAHFSMRPMSRARGLPGVVWEARVTSDRASGEDPIVLRVNAREGASTAAILEPARTRGPRVLQVASNMWILQPGMKKPVAISPRQRLSGQAALGDIASTEYARDCTPTYLRQESIDGVPCHVLQLVATAPNTTYDRITYWISQARGLGIRADFLSVSGKVLRQADFAYDCSITRDGRRLPFLSRMSLRDVLTGESTVLEYCKVQVQAIPPSEFDSGMLQ